MLEGAAIALISLAIGYLTGRRAKRLPVERKAKPATCGCGHVRSMHEGGKGKCTEIMVEFEWIGPGGNQTKTLVEYPCACQIYDGPEPLPTMYAPEIQP